VIVEFAVNNQIYTATNILPFIANYSRELRMRANIRRKGKVEKVIEFAEKMKRVQEEARTALRKVQKDIKRYAENWKKSNKVMLNTRDLIFKKRPVKKLTKKYVGPYEIKEVILRNVVKLKLLVSMRIHLVVNISRIERYKKLVRKQRVEKLKPVEVDGVEEWEVEKILNKRKV